MQQLMEQAALSHQLYRTIPSAIWLWAQHPEFTEGERVWGGRPSALCLRDVVPATERETVGSDQIHTAKAKQKMISY